jgi:hypothetical protein
MYHKSKTYKIVHHIWVWLDAWVMILEALLTILSLGFWRTSLSFRFVTYCVRWEARWFIPRRTSTPGERSPCADQ